MKKFLALILALVMVLGLVACGEKAPVDDGADAGDEVVTVTDKIAMVTDYGDITDQSFNQTTYEACKAFAEANGYDFTYYKPAGDSDAFSNLPASSGIIMTSLECSSSPVSGCSTSLTG